MLANPIVPFFRAELACRTSIAKTRPGQNVNSQTETSAKCSRAAHVPLTMRSDSDVDRQINPHGKQHELQICTPETYLHLRDMLTPQLLCLLCQAAPLRQEELLMLDVVVLHWSQGRAVR
jgi:hypothetical protein